MSELIGAELDLLVAKIIGTVEEVSIGTSKKMTTDYLARVNGGMVSGVYTHGYDMSAEYSPSTNWSQGGPLIEEYRIDIHYNTDPVLNYVCDAMSLVTGGIDTGPTPLIAAMRALVENTKQRDLKL